METLATHFAGILAGLRFAIGAHLGRDLSRAPVLTLVWSRLARVSQRIQHLFARYQAGTLPQPRPPRPARLRQPREYRRTPTGRAWLVVTIGYQAANHASQLQHLLARPDLADFLAAAPQAARLLRPLCHSLGITPPFALPPKPSAAKPRTPKPRPPRAPRIALRRPRIPPPLWPSLARRRPPPT